MNIAKIIINKNRGWRGLAEVKCINDSEEEVLKMIFSFSEPVWRDMLRGIMVVQDEDHYIILRFDDPDAKLPKPTQQRSVLIKYFMANVMECIPIPKRSWEGQTRGTAYYDYIYNFTKNRNNHTQSDWNCIGIRVVPMI